MQWNCRRLRVGALWISLVTFGLYLVITVGAVTHRTLFLENPVRLPVLGVDMPLVGFFVVAPILFVFYHFYTFLQLRSLAVRATHYNEVLRSGVPISADRARIRQRLDTFIFLQILADPGEPLGGWTPPLLRLVGWLTVVGAPILLLLQIQITFLPYHYENVTWLHRALVAIDLILAWLFWSIITTANRSSRRGLRGRVIARALAFAGTALVATFSGFFAIFPGETLYPYRSPVTRILFEGTPNYVTGTPTTPFANRLLLPNQSLAKSSVAMSASNINLASARGRNLRGAIFDRSDLRDLDFTGSDLQNASLAGADLRGATLSCLGARQKFNLGINPDAYKPSTDQCSDPARSCVCARGATFDFADLRGANLMFADIKGASFAFADMTGSSLDGAQLQGATFIGSNLRAASLVKVVADGASIRGSDMRGAILDGSSLFGAVLQDVYLQAASFRLADLSYSNFSSAHFEGADLSSVNLAGAELWGVGTYRAVFFFKGGALVHYASDAPVTQSFGQFGYEFVWDLRVPNDYWHFFENTTQDVQGVWHFPALLRKLAKLDPNNAADRLDESEAKTAWSELEKQSQDPASESKIRTSIVREMLRKICDSGADEFFVLGVTKNLIYLENRSGNPQIDIDRSADGAKLVYKAKQGLGLGCAKTIYAP